MDAVWVFPGQGSQLVGMGTRLRQESKEATRIFQLTDAEVDGDLIELCQKGPTKELNRTCYAQPALFATALSALAWWQEREGASAKPWACTGHSVGALTAAVAAGYLDVAEGARLVAERGRLMESAPGEGSMLAVAASPERRDAIAALAEETGLAIATYNGPRQVVLSGPRAGIAAAAAKLGAKAKELAVSHAFHSPMMAPALDQWSDCVEKAEFSPSDIPYLRNCDGQATTDLDEVREDLRIALVSPVNWTAVMETASQNPTWIGFGPSRALVSMARHMPGAPQLKVVDR